MKKSILLLEFGIVLLILMTTFQLNAQRLFLPKSPDALSDFSYTIANDAQTTSKILEFDLYLLDTDNSQDFELAQVQAGIVVNSSIKNGGNITATIVPGTSELLASQIPTTITFAAATNCIKMATRTPPGAGNGSILSKIAPGTRICRIRLTNTVDYPAGVTTNLTFNFTTTPYATKVMQYISGTNTELVCNSSNCTSNATNIYLNAWQGGTSTDWATASNWNPPAVPAETWNAYIPNPVTHNVVVNEASGSPAVCNNLTISLGSSLTIESGGSLITSGSITNNGTIVYERTLTGAAQSWHFISSPMASGTISGNGWNPTIGQDDFYAWDEPSSGTWVNYHNTTTAPTFATVNGSADGFVPGKGYLVAYNTASPTKSFTAGAGVTPTTGNASFTLASTTDGWNLLGNPYASGIDWNLANRSQLEDEYAYIYDPNKSGGEGYIQVNGAAANAYIGATQGFFVKAKSSANGQNFQFTPAMQVHAGTSYKTTNTDHTLSIRLSGNLFYDEVSTSFNQNATFLRDRHDAVKLFSLNNAIPQVFTFSSDHVRLSVNTIPDKVQQDHLMMGMLIPASGEYQLSADDQALALFPEGLFLEDMLLGQIHNLNSGSYTFTTEEGTIENRFKLLFGAVGVDPSPASPVMKAWYNHDMLSVSNVNGNFEITVFTATGTRVYQKTGSSNGFYSQQLNLDRGFYLIEISTATERLTLKIIKN